MFKLQFQIVSSTFLKAMVGLCAKVWQAFSDFSSRTSIGGLSHAGHSASRLRQVLWMVIFIVLSSYTVKLLMDNVNQYLDYGVKTSTDLTYNPGQLFPAITICNQNKFLLIIFHNFIYDLSIISLQIMY